MENIMKIEIDWLEYNEINLRKSFCDQISCVEMDHSIHVVANALYMNPFKPTKPKQITPVCTELYEEYPYTIGKTQVVISWDNSKNNVQIWFKNVSQPQYFCPFDLINYL